ncbi:UNVERIFIED_ORG: hypothetical protein GGI57_002819 [Rhizobium aethiopicum]
MPDIDIKAQALSDARTRILKLQEQMTERVLKMAAEVEKLMEIVPFAEAKAFLKPRCGGERMVGAEDWCRAMRRQPFHDRFGNLVQIGALSSTLRGRTGKGRSKEDARWRSKGFTYAPIPKAAPTNEDAMKEGFVPGLTLRMRARLQDFPDDWQFVGGFEKVAVQIGNAVTVRVAKAIGLAIVSALKGLEIDWENMLPHPPRTQRQVIEAPPLAPLDHAEDHKSFANHSLTTNGDRKSDAKIICRDDLAYCPLDCLR